MLVICLLHHYIYLVLIMLRLGTIVTKRLFAASLSPKDWGLSDDYEIFSSLGKGSSARVFMGVNVVSRQKVVIKMFKQLPVDSIKQQININLKLLSGLKSNGKHAEFIPLLDTCYDQSSSAFTLIYQFFPGVPLNELIANISLSDALRNALILAHTLKYIHSMGLIHRDIKPANVLITPKGPKLFDFGLAKFLDQEEDIKTNNFGTKCYKSPQVIFRMSSYNQSVDIWGLGLIIAETVLNKRHLLPYQSDASMIGQVATLCALQEADTTLFKKDLLQYIRIDKHKSWQALAKKKEINPDIIDLVKRMIQINPAKRPSINEVIEHPAFREVKLQ